LAGLHLIDLRARALQSRRFLSATGACMTSTAGIDYAGVSDVVRQETAVNDGIRRSGDTITPDKSIKLMQAYSASADLALTARKMVL
jgi:hypothetical protein